MHPLAVAVEGVSIEKGLGTRGTQQFSAQMGLMHVGADSCLRS